MPTIVGILTFVSMINFMLIWVEHEFFITLGTDRLHLKTSENQQRQINVPKKQVWVKGFRMLRLAFHIILSIENRPQNTEFDR